MVESLQQTRSGDATAGTDWRAAYRELEAERSEPEWLTERRSAAMDRFDALGFPTTRQEVWRYTNVARLARTAFEPAHEAIPGDELDELTVPLLTDPAVIRLVFVDGVYAAHLSANSPRLSQGVVVEALADILAGDESLVEPHLAVQAYDDDQAFVALNTALFVDGGFVKVPAGKTLDAPVHVHHVTTSRAEPHVAHPRTVVVLGEGSRATVLESYHGAAGPYCADPMTEIEVGAGAHLDHYRLQVEGPEASHLATTKVRVARDGELRSQLISLGGALVRNLIEVTFTEPGASCSLGGLYFADGAQHMDCQTFVDHAVPHCTSDQSYRGILAGSSRGVFQGGVLVRPDAQKTSARQSNKSLVLSPNAKADTKPQLEIHADDVQCAHGATVGQLDPAAVFFLRSRGLDEAGARRMLTRAFAGEVAREIRLAEFHRLVEGLLEDRLAATGEGAGRDAS